MHGRGIAHQTGIVLGVFLALLFVACSSGTSRFIAPSEAARSYSGYVMVATVATAPSTGPGILTLVSPDGTDVSVVQDLFISSEYVTGLAYLGSDRVAVGVDGADRIDVYNLLTGALTAFAVNVNITATPLRNMVSTADGSVYIVESNTNTVEKVDSSGSRVGAPFLPTTVGSCVLSAPYGVAYDSANGRVAVISSAASGRLSIYNDTTGTCIAHVTTAPFNSGFPAGIAYHAPSGKYIVTFNTSHAIYSVDANGANAAQIYLNSAIINTPRTVATDTAGNIYVSSEGTDTVEKLYWSGSGTATRALSGPLLGPSVYSQNPTAILVIP